jgi:hypothetical protein
MADVWAHGVRTDKLQTFADKVTVVERLLAEEGGGRQGGIR